MSKINELGGGLFDCFSDMNICLCGTFCAICQLAQTLEDTDGGSFALNFCMLCCIPCWFPICTSMQMNKSVFGLPSVPY